jgi:ribosomal protein L17
VATSGAQLGNTNNSKGKMITDELRKVLVQNDRLKVRRIVEKLVEAAEEGDSWAIKEVFDRMDGKPQMAVEMSGTLDLKQEVVNSGLERISKTLEKIRQSESTN